MGEIIIFGLTGKALFTILVILVLFLSLILTKVKTEIAFVAAITALILFGVLDCNEAFSGLSSSSLLTVGVIYVVIAGLTYTGVLNIIVKYLLGTPKSLSGAITRLMMPVALLSSFLSNTTIVALFINVVRIWSKKLGISPSKLLIPLSYASGMGGICTLIGTPPNMIISGMYAEQSGNQMGIFAPTLTGLVCLAVGILSMIAMQKLLPERKSPLSEGNAADFTTELLVPSDSPYIGMTYGECHELHKSIGNIIKNGTAILAIRHFDGEMSQYSDDEFIIGGDRIIISGKTMDILSLSKNYGFKNENLEGVMSSDIDDSAIGKKTIISSLVMISMVLLSAFHILPLLTSALLAACAMVALKCCNSDQALKSINWNILIIFAGSIAIGKAIENTGLAEMIANSILGVCGTNPYVVLSMLCLVATFITEFISNTAAAAMFYPIAMFTASKLGVNPMPFLIALMIAASSSFATPIGSTTHMLVYGPGGYKFSDFFRVGFLMNIIILAANIIITTMVYPF